MRSVAYANAILLSTPCLADGSVLLRDGAPRRLLEWIWAVGAPRVVDGVRGTVWICQDWLASHLGVKRGTLRQALTRLRQAGWIMDAITSDRSGHPRRGLVFANDAYHGFANSLRTPDESIANGSRIQNESTSSLKLKEDQITPVQSDLPRCPRQSTLPGSHFETPAGRPSSAGSGPDGKRRDPRLHEVAERVDQYERHRYDAHPRRVRPKRDTPEARSISVEAITKALERVVESEQLGTLELIETRFRAVVELNWDAAERKAETWDWWTGSAMWTPTSLDRVLGWLEEKRNWVYIKRAEGKSELPMRAPDHGDDSPIPDDLSPTEQQWAYDAIQRPRNYNHSTIDGGISVMVDMPAEIAIPTDPPWRPALQAGPTNAELDAIEQLSDCIERGDAPGLAELSAQVAGTMKYMEFPKESDEVRKRRNELQVLYLQGTSPEERAADSKAGRKPWEGKSDD